MRGRREEEVDDDKNGKEKKNGKEGRAERCAAMLSFVAPPTDTGSPQARVAPNLRPRLSLPFLSPSTSTSLLPLALLPPLLPFPLAPLRLTSSCGGKPALRIKRMYWKSRSSTRSFCASPSSVRDTEMSKDAPIAISREFRLTKAA